MRIVKDVFGDIEQDGQLIHTKVRFLIDDKQRLAVFTGRGAPTNVYSLDDVTWTQTRKPCACKGDPPKQTLQRFWEQAEKVTA